MISTAMRHASARVLRLTLIGSLSLTMAPQLLFARGFESGATLFGDDLFMAGSDVRIADGSRGDAILAGAWISTAGAVHGDEVATGGQVNLGADVDGGVYAAGGRVRLEGRVGRSARVAGGHVEVGPEADVQGGLTIGGGEVAVNGRVGKYLQVGAGSTRIDAHVGGNVEVASGNLSVGPDAVIDGALTYYGPQPASIDSAARIRGGTHFVERKHWNRYGHRRAFGVGAWLWLAGWIIAGSILVALWPGFAHSVSEIARRSPGIVLLLGFAVLVCVPVALLLLVLTIIGIPLALLLLFLYLLLLPLGYLAAAAAIGEWLLARSQRGTQALPRRRILMLIVVLVVLFVLTRIPVFGAALRFLLVLAGVGSLVMAGALRQRGETATATTT
jgi:hypothetical protein